MPDDPSPAIDACRCGHPRSSHGSADHKCRQWINAGLEAGTYCTCNAFSDEASSVTADRRQALVELLEHVATLDRRYARLPLPPWAA